jgi:hypothetical protein
MSPGLSDQASMGHHRVCAASYLLRLRAATDLTGMIVHNYGTFSNVCKAPLSSIHVRRHQISENRFALEDDNKLF